MNDQDRVEAITAAHVLVEKWKWPKEKFRVLATTLYDISNEEGEVE